MITCCIYQGMISYDRTVIINKEEVEFVYIKSNWDYCVVNDSVNDEDCELFACKVNREHNRRTLVVVIYRPPAGKFKNFFDKIRVFLTNNFNFKKENIVIVEDFNINIIQT